MKAKKEPVLRPSAGRIIVIFIGVFIIFEIIFYASFQGVFNNKLWPLDQSFFYYTPALLGASILFCVLSIVQTSYEVTPLKLVHIKMGKESEYFWSDIIYIDEEFSTRKKMMLFYTKDGKDHYLAFDKNAVIYTTALQKCHLISKEEFQRKFPNKKI